MKVVITLGGGSRGLGKAILDTYCESGFTKLAYHKSLLSDDQYYLDLNFSKSVDRSVDHLIDYLLSLSNCLVSLHILTGGSLSISQPASLFDVQTVMLHNFLFPVMIIDRVLLVAEKLADKCVDICITTYTTSAVKNYSSSSYYRSSKAALDSYFESTVKMFGSKVSFFHLRLGVMNIEHKYFANLQRKNPIEFESFLQKTVPTRVFANPYDVASFSLDLINHKKLTSGSMIDISGGNSWT